jgi:hypothetical protein
MFGASLHVIPHDGKPSKLRKSSRHDPKLINIQSLELQIRIKQITHCPRLPAPPVSVSLYRRMS